MSWLTGQFSTRVIALMPVAIAINIVLGYTVQTVLKLPIYLDSIGTILVGVLAGPIAGAVTGVLTNLIWQYAPGIGGGTIGPFAIVAGVIGLLAGLWGYLGVYRRRPAEGANLWLPVLISVAVIWLLAFPIVNNPVYNDPAFFVSWYTTAIIAVAAVLSLAVVVLAVTRRDAAPAWVAVAGAVTGVIAAICSAPISAILFGGVTGSGTDVIVAALRQGGADVFNAALGQGFFSDPIDKTITSFVVFVILTSLSRRLIAHIPMASARSGRSTPEPRRALTEAAPPEYVTRAPAGRYVGLNPTTKLTISFAEAAVAFLLGGWTGPLLVLGLVFTTAAASGVTRRMLPFVLATIPLVASILLVNTFIYPGATDAFATIGPFTATWTGLTVAGQATLRVIAFALSVAVFALTTATDDLLSDLERRGLGRRGVFVIGAAISTVPRMIERAGEIVDSQRARGLDTEGRPWRRVRGLLPLAGPMITGALTEVEERTMALEARAFSAPARRTTIRRLPDSTVQRLLRWGVLLLVLAVIVGTVAGWLDVP